MKKQTQRVFQFSSIDDKEYLAKIKIAIKLLNGSFDESRLYSPKATHLIVDKMECTEKTLCFIAAGKWIVTPSYIKNSYRENRFLDEAEHHVSIKFPRSKLATVSLKWMNKIKDDKKKYPCYGWRVACFLNNHEKAKAIARIIEAANGTCHLMKQASNVRSARVSVGNYTLVICDDLTNSEATEFADKRGLLCYPFQAIPDYLMQSMQRDNPVLPLKHYGSLSSLYSSSSFNGSKHKLNNESAEKMDISYGSDDKSQIFNNNKLTENFIEAMYRTYFLNIKPDQKTKIKLIDLHKEGEFRIYWQNDGGIYEALNILRDAQGLMVSVSSLVLLYEYLLDEPYNRISKIQKSMSVTTKVAKNNYKCIYKLIYDYLLRILIEHPPTSSPALDYYHETFESLSMAYRMSMVSGEDVYGLIDVLYLMSFHDYIIFNKNSSSNIYHHISLRWTETDREKLHWKLIDVLTSLPNASTIYYRKLFEIISFCNFYINSTTLMQNASRYISKHNLNDANSFKHIFSQLTATSN